MFLFFNALTDNFDFFRFIPTDPLGPDFLTVKIMDDFFRIPTSVCYLITKHPKINGTEKPKESAKFKSPKIAPDNEVTAGETLPRKKTKMIQDNEVNIKTEVCIKEEETKFDLDDVPLYLRSMCTEKRKRRKKISRTVKMKTTTYECQSCGIKFLRRGQYNRHLVTHSLHARFRQSV